MQWVLVLLVFPPFVLFGIQGFNGFTRNRNAVAEVAGHDISQGEWESAQRQQIDLMRSRMPNVDAKIFDTPAFRQQSLDAVIRNKVLERAAQDRRLYISDARLKELFDADDRYAFLRNPDGTLNQELLRAKGVTSAMLAEQLRHEYTVQQVLAGIADSAGRLPVVSDVALKAFTEQRDIRVMPFSPAQYLPQVTVSDAELKQYYDDPAHAAEIRVPEQVSLQYMVLDMATVKARIKLSDDQVRQYYEQNKARYTTPEERRVSHILIKVAPSASPQDKQAAHDKAEKILQLVRQNPSDFAELARKYSEDPGSASAGGDLDYIQSGTMVKPFEDAAFSLKPHAISDLVLTDYGYHIIKVDDVRGGTVQPFDAVKDQIEADIRNQMAAQEFAKVAERFGDQLEQSDTLKEVGQAMDLPVSVADHVTRTPRNTVPEGQPITDPLDSDKFLRAVFDPTNLKSPRNTDPIEIAPNRLAAARVLQYTPSRVMTFDEARATLVDKVKMQKALRLAREAALKQLAAWKAMPASAPATPVVEVSRQDPHDVAPDVLRAAMAVPAGTVPAWGSVDLGAAGEAVIEVVAVKHPAVTPQQEQGSQQEYARLWGQAEAQAYLADLKSTYKARITALGRKLIDKNEDQGAP